MPVGPGGSLTTTRGPAHLGARHVRQVRHAQRDGVLMVHHVAPGRCCGRAHHVDAGGGLCQGVNGMVLSAVDHRWAPGIARTTAPAPPTIGGAAGRDRARGTCAACPWLGAGQRARTDPARRLRLGPRSGPPDDAPRALDILRKVARGGRAVDLPVVGRGPCACGQRARVGGLSPVGTKELGVDAAVGLDRGAFPWGELVGKPLHGGRGRAGAEHDSRSFIGPAPARSGVPWLPVRAAGRSVPRWLRADVPRPPVQEAGPVGARAGERARQGGARPQGRRRGAGRPAQLPRLGAAPRPLRRPMGSAVPCTPWRRGSGPPAAAKHRNRAAGHRERADGGAGRRSYKAALARRGSSMLMGPRVAPAQLPNKKGGATLPAQGPGINAAGPQTGGAR